MKFAKYVYLSAGVYGILVTAPLYFMEEKLGIDYPPAISHPEYFYGFVGVVLAWQLAFFLIGSDPVRYRPLMLVTLVEKFSYAIAAPILFWQGRIPMMMFAAGLVDLALGILFLLAYLKTPATFHAAAESKTKFVGTSKTSATSTNPH